MFRVLAEVVYVQIELDRPEINFVFADDSHSMYTTEIVNLTNNGNAAAHYEWKNTEDCCFSIEKLKG